VTPLFIAAASVFLTFRILEGGFALKPGQVDTNLSGRAIILAVASIAAGIFLVGPLAGIALVIGIAIHEYGHVAAFRAMGHTDARFRMIPFLGGVAISQQMPRDQLSDFYISIMGPGIMLAPLIISGVVAENMWQTSPNIAHFAQTMFIITGAINFFNLLPLWPLDGGRIIRTVTFGFWPGASPIITRIMAIGLAVWAFYTGRWLILVVAIFGFNSARQIKEINQQQPAMTGRQALFATVAYLCALGAHGLAGAPLIRSLLFPG